MVNFYLSFSKTSINDILGGIHIPADVIYGDENSEVTRGDLSEGSYLAEGKKLNAINKNVYDRIRKWLVLEMTAIASKDTIVDRIQDIFKDVTFKTNKDDKGNSKRLRNPVDLSIVISNAAKNNEEEIYIITECETFIATKYFIGRNFNELYNFDQRQDIDDDDKTTNHQDKDDIANNKSKSRHNYNNEDIDIDDNYDINDLPIQVSDRLKIATNTSEYLTAEQVNTPMNWEDGENHKLYYENTNLIGNRIILCNGMILESKLKQKEFLKEPPILHGKSPHQIRHWYKRLLLHALCNGYYIVPYERFNLQNNSNGFEFGIDLPERKRINLDAWANDINKLLLKNNVLPKEYG